MGISLLRRFAKRRVAAALTSERTAAALTSALDRYRGDAGFLRLLEQSDLPIVALSLAMMPNARAQMFQDVWVLHESKFRRNGYFVEVGALDGVRLSNTFLLEKQFGWTGLLVEPNPAHHASIARHRLARLCAYCVHSVSGPPQPFWVTADSELSSLAACAGQDFHADRRLTGHTEIMVPVRSLNELLQEHEVPRGFDYLSLDTEGNESDILSTFDFAYWRPQLMTIEHNRGPQEERIASLLAANGYSQRHKRLSRHDGWYRRDDSAETV
jgi:FkbM family methyltransferase